MKFTEYPFEELAAAMELQRELQEQVATATAQAEAAATAAAEAVAAAAALQASTLAVGQTSATGVGHVERNPDTTTREAILDSGLVNEVELAAIKVSQHGSSSISLKPTYLFRTAPHSRSRYKIRH